MRYLFITSWISSLLNFLMQLDDGLYMGATGWFCTMLFSTSLLIKEHGKERSE